MPTNWYIERHEDGSATIWCSEHEPMNRMKGMHGICLHPGSAVVEIKVRVNNRTPLAQTFLWWANVGILVHDHYQAFFPPDVTYVADHAKRAISSFPIARNFYYGVDYRQGVDISWYKNIPVPTSYMVTESKYDFFGGYDHQQKAGVVHFANHHIAPGKKLWTWGNAEFGYAWDRNLTDSDGPYIELMAGVFTDNQPDFSWLHPYETRTWSQFWYPIQEIGPAKNANRLAAVNLEHTDGKLKIGVCVTEPFDKAKLLVTVGEEKILEDIRNLEPGKPYLRNVLAEGNPVLQLFTKDGKEIIQYRAEAQSGRTSLPEPATEPPAPKEIHSNDELYITGLHLEQYRHATRYPEPYWEEALRRDRFDSRSNTALGLLKLRRGQLTEAEMHFRLAIQRQTKRNPNPAEGDAYYYLGLTLQYQERLEEAYSAYYKAVWNYAWQSAAYYQLAEIACRHLDFDRALEHLEQSLKTNTEHLKAHNLRTAILRKLGAHAEATKYAQGTHALDPVDSWSRHELAALSAKNSRLIEQSATGSGTRTATQLHLDLALDYAAAGYWADARDVLSTYAAKSGQRVYPMVLYLLGYCADKQGDHAEAAAYWANAAKASPDYCFPARIEEMIVLQTVLRASPDDSRAHYYLGDLFYDKKRYEEAIHEWESSAKLDSAFALPWRNLGIAYFNVHNNSDKALLAYESAFKANPGDSRLLYEWDQLRKRSGICASQRIAHLESHPDLVSQRDDLTVELIALLNQSGQPEQAMKMLLSRRFNPWEGGEGLVSAQYVWSHVLIGRSLLERGAWDQALAHFSAAREYPQNLGEGKHLLTRETHLDYFSGLTLSEMGRKVEANRCWNRAVADSHPITWLTFYAAMSLEALGRKTEADKLFEEIRTFAEHQIQADVKIDYFATSLPNLLLFEDNLQKRNHVDCLFLLALSELGMRNTERAVELLNEVLTLDCNHIAAQLELQHLKRMPAVAGTRQ